MTKLCHPTAKSLVDRHRTRRRLEGAFDVRPWGSAFYLVSTAMRLNEPIDGMMLNVLAAYSISP
jgi:hypothetical protein